MAQCLARVCHRDPLPGRAAPVRPLHLSEAGHPPCVVGIVSITAASHHVPGITGGSISHRLPLLLLSLLLQSPLASLIPQAPAAHSFRIKTQSSAGLLSLSAVGGKLHPIYLKKFASRGSKPAPCICTLRLSSWRGRLCAPVVGKGLPGLEVSSSCSLPRFPGRRAFLTGCCSLSMWVAPGTVLRTVQVLSDSPVRERGCSFVKVVAVAMKSGPAAFFFLGDNSFTEM